jgi:elongation factor Ts
MSITTKEIQTLREKSGAGMMDCKKALEESAGDIEKAIDCLRKKGAATALKRADKEAKEGYVAVYSHGGRIGSMVEVNCETDFVAKNEDFKKFAMDIAMQVAASSPAYLSRSDVPKEVVAKEQEIEMEKIKGEKKPKEILDKIISGKIDKFYAEVCLLEQTYIKDDKLKVQDLLNEKLASIGEKIEIKRFVRFELGDK